MYKKILVPLDGSELAERALVDLKIIASAGYAPEITLLMVVKAAFQGIPVYYQEMRGESPGSRAEAEVRAYAENYLQKVADSLKAEGISAQMAVVHGDPAKEIINYSENNQMNLIIISSFGSSGASRWALGKVTDRVVHYSRVPVLVVRPA